jgi:hypothetical protein
MVTAPGFHDGIDEAVYHSDRDSLSVSGAKVILKAPALFRWQQEHPVHKDVFDFGSAAHKAVLGVGPQLVVHQYDVEKVKSPKATNAWKAQQAEVREAGNILLLPDEYQSIMTMADALSSHALAMRLLSGGRAEVSAYAVHERTGVLRRCRYDWLGDDGIAVDFKTTVDADPAGFGRTAVNFGYAMQAAYYIDVAETLGEPLRAFAFVNQMKEPPFLVSVCELDAEALAYGRSRNERALEMFRDCMESGIWPGFQADGAFTTVSLPEWALRQEWAPP